MANIILQHSVKELSIDLLLLEEFYVSNAFRTWFLEKTYGKGDLGTLTRLEHSSLELERESDLFLTFENKEGAYFILIENKINAQFQPDQAKDYKKRASGYIERGECIDCKTVFIAPRRYIASAKEAKLFDCTISYEELIEYFQAQSSERARFKINLLTKATNKSSKHQSEGDPTITRFWADFWQDISVNVPELHLEKPGPKPAFSSFISETRYQSK